MKRYACPTFPHFIHGADYNPEQWIHDKSVWDKDMELMQLANCNEMSVGIFSWAMLEPREGEYDFAFLDEVIDRIYNNGGRVILATPSGARPHWMADKYPEVLRTMSDGKKEHFRARHNHCFTSPVYREKVRAINTELAKRYGNHPAVIAWHISNEYSGECHCEYCKNAFRSYLRQKFDDDIEKLNLAYWATFWSHHYDNFEQIEPPGKLTENAIHGLNLDWHRFVTLQTADFIRNETAPIRQYSPNIPVTTNMMFEFYDLDYHVLSETLDFISWDSYPEWHNGDDAIIAAKTAFWHDLYRSLKTQPFFLMESTPSLVNWKPFNKPKRPGLDVLSSIQAVAHGSDSVQYFQWRKGRGSSEKFHGAVVGHDGTADTRVFRSVQVTGRILKKLDAIAGTVTHSPAAIIFSWENMWALDDCQGYANVGKKYFDTCYSYHRFFWEHGINCDIVSPHEDLSQYSLVVAPMLYLTDRETIQSLRSYVSGGGTLLGTYMMGTVDENDLCYLGGIPADDLKDVFGIVAEEIDTLYPTERQHATMAGLEHELVDYCEVLQLHGAQPLAVYTDGYYEGQAAVTIHFYGDGKAIYQACRDDGSLKEQLLTSLLHQCDIVPNLGQMGKLPHGITAHSRTDGEYTYLFVENYCASETHVIPLPKSMENMLTDAWEQECTLKPYSFGVYRTSNK